MLKAYKAAAPRSSLRVAPGRRHRMICEAAYYLALERGFEAGHDLDDWLLAELEMDARLGLLPPEPKPWSQAEPG